MFAFGDWQTHQGSQGRLKINLNLITYTVNTFWTSHQQKMYPWQKLLKDGLAHKFPPNLEDIYPEMQYHSQKAHS